MFFSGSKYRYIFILFAILMFSFGILLLQKKVSLREGGIGDFISAVFTPVNNMFTWSGKGAKDLISTIFNATALKRENDSLKAENQKLVYEIEKVRMYKEENLSLRQLLDLKRAEYDSGIAAEIIARDPTNWFENFTINRGRTNGISRNMIVLSLSGLVGKVSSVNYSSASICTITNPKSSVPVYMVESGSFGILYGDGSPLCNLEFIRNSSFMQEGNLVVTSGIGNIYPPGIIIGKTVNVQRSSDGLSYMAKVKPFINLDNLREVLIVRGKVD